MENFIKPTDSLQDLYVVLETNTQLNIGAFSTLKKAQDYINRLDQIQHTEKNVAKQKNDCYQTFLHKNPIAKNTKELPDSSWISSMPLGLLPNINMFSEFEKQEKEYIEEKKSLQQQWIDTHWKPAYFHFCITQDLPYQESFNFNESIGETIHPDYIHYHIQKIAFME